MQLTISVPCHRIYFAHFQVAYRYMLVEINTQGMKLSHASPSANDMPVAYNQSGTTTARPTRVFPIFPGFREN